MVARIGAILLAAFLVGCGAAGERPPDELWRQTGCVEQLGCRSIVAEKSAQKDVSGGDIWCIVVQQGSGRVNGTVRLVDGVWTRAIALKSSFEELGCARAAEEAA